MNTGVLDRHCLSGADGGRERGEWSRCSESCRNEAGLAVRKLPQLLSALLSVDNYGALLSFI